MSWVFFIGCAFGAVVTYFVFRNFPLLILKGYNIDRAAYIRKCKNDITAIKQTDDEIKNILKDVK